MTDSLFLESLPVPAPKAGITTVKFGGAVGKFLGVQCEVVETGLSQVGGQPMLNMVVTAVALVDRTAPTEEVSLVLAHVGDPVPASAEFVGMIAAVQGQPLRYVFRLVRGEDPLVIKPPTGLRM